MVLTVKLYATLSGHLPPDSINHSTQIEVDDDMTPHGIIDRFNVPRESAHLILINGVYIQPKQRDEAIFSDGDTVAVWPPVAGG